jgi:CDP-diacylglycerol---glycerol-3-phosphate 3-phosphatidyltransferase
MIDFIKRMNLPNKLTLLRIVLVPVFCVFISIRAPWAQLVAALVFIGASITDLFDGKIARRDNLITDFGKLMDPIADKLLVTAAMVFLTAQHRMMAGVCMVFIAREFIISGFRMIAASRGKVIAAGPLGKYKTATEMVSLPACMLCLAFDGCPAVLNSAFLAVLAQIILWIALALAVLSCIDYILRNKDVIDTTKI